MPLVVFVFLFSVSLAATTSGPLAPISIQSLQAYITARPCAASCVVYQGIWNCNYNAGYNDLGKAIGCNCNPLNACFCSAGLQSSATSYLSSCISVGCKALGNVDGDVKSMLDLYSGYCATANVEVSSKPAENSAAVTSPAQAATSKATTRNVGASGPTATGASLRQAESSGSTAAPENEEKAEEGLSKSDIIALATGLGVGLPSLAIGALALWFQLRRRRAAAEAPHIALNITPAESQTQFLPQPTPQPHIAYPHAYELGDRSGQRPMWG
jgi:hypothetical protein